MYEEIEAAGSNLREVAMEQREADKMMRRQRLNDEEKEGMMRMLAEGEPYRVIAEKFDVAEKYVGVFRAKHKVKIMELKGLNIDGTPMPGKGGCKVKLTQDALSECIEQAKKEAEAVPEKEAEEVKAEEVCEACTPLPTDSGYEDKKRLRLLNAAIEWADVEHTYQSAYGDNTVAAQVSDMWDEMIKLRERLYGYMVKWEEVAK